MTIALLLELAQRELPVSLRTTEEVHGALSLEAASFIEAKFSKSGRPDQIDGALVTKITALGKKQIATSGRLRGRRRIAALHAGAYLVRLD